MGDILPQMSSMIFLRYMGLKDKFSSTNTPQQNGVVERKNRTVQEATRTMLNETKMSDAYWIG